MLNLQVFLNFQSFKKSKIIVENIFLIAFSCFIQNCGKPLNTPGIIKREGMDKIWQRIENLQKPYTFVVGNRSRSSGKDIGSSLRSSHRESESRSAASRDSGRNNQRRIERERASSLNRIDSSHVNKPLPNHNFVRHHSVEETDRARSRSRSSCRDACPFHWPSRERSNSMSRVGSPTDNGYGIRPSNEDNELFKPMWSWYYGENDTNPQKITVTSKNSKKPVFRNNQHHNFDPTSIDLTEALDPDWYFREKNELTDSRGILKSPGQIKQVGFGKNKVAFLDILGSENINVNSTRYL